MESFKDNLVLRNIILDHYENPSNRLKQSIDISNFLSFHNKSATCIDDIIVYIQIENDIVINSYFDGIGCAISVASTDILCNILKNKTINQAQKIIDNYYNMINEKEYDKDLLDELIAFYNISNQPNRIKCAKIGVDSFFNILNKNEK